MNGTVDNSSVSKATFKLIAALALIWLVRALSDTLFVYGYLPEEAPPIITFFCDFSSAGIAIYYVYLCFSVMRATYLLVMIAVSVVLLLLRNLVRLFPSAGALIGLSPEQFGVWADGVFAFGGALVLLGVACTLLLSLHRSIQALMEERSKLLASAEQREVDQKLLEKSENQFRTLAELAPVAIFIAQDSKFLYANQLAMQKLGYSAEELPYLNVEELIDPKETAPVVKATQAMLDGSDSGPITLSFFNKSGEARRVELSVARIHVDGRRAFLATAYDITEHEKLEEQYRHSQKMEALGKLAGGVAHDFNNILTAIFMECEILSSELVDSPALCEQVQSIMTSATRASSLSQQLLAFSRKQPSVPRILKLNDVVRDLEKMLQRLMTETITLKSVFGANPDTIVADASHIEQILLNLAVNARDAMVRGGTITIETRTIDLDKKAAAELHDLKPGRHVVLCFTDTGCGIDDGIQRRIFEPFFTTKSEGSGTGLGLSTVYGNVKKWGGHVTVSSRKGEGAQFNIYFPVADKPVEEEKPQAAAAVRGERPVRILVVEDDPLILNMTCRILTRLGYDVLSAENADVALTKCRELDGKLDLVLTDVVMPGMSGAQLAEEVVKTWHDVKVLFMTGYTADVIFNYGVLAGKADVLQKPFNRDTLLAAIHQVISK